MSSETLAHMFKETRIGNGLSLTDAAGQMTSTASLSRFENDQQRFGNEKTFELMNDIGLARQDINNLLYDSSSMPFLRAHNETSTLIAKHDFAGAERVVREYKLRADESGNPLATINAIELRTKVRRRRDKNYRLPVTERQIVTKFFKTTNGNWTDHEYELFAHICNCIPPKKAYAIYRPISEKLRSGELLNGYIPSLLFCIRNLLLQAIKNNEMTIAAEMLVDATALPTGPFLGDVDAVFIAASRQFCIRIAEFAVDRTDANADAALAANQICGNLIGMLGVSEMADFINNMRKN